MTKPALIAEMVLSQGNVQAKSLMQALDALAEAVHERPARPPFGAVIRSANDSPDVPLVWRRYLSAVDQARSALSVIHIDDPSVLLRAKTLGPGIEIVFSSLGPDPVVYFAGHGVQSGPTMVEQVQAASDDVLLLMSGAELTSAMELATSKLSDFRVLLRVAAEHLHRQEKSFVADVVSTPEDNNDDNSEGPTLSWRKRFIQDVPTWSADEVAEQGGYSAKNKSAAANRWATDGKIFSVSHGGKQCYPRFQFKHGQPRPIVARILHALGPEKSGWDRAFFFATPNSYLGDAKPIDRLDDKSMEDLLVQLANRHAHPADVF
jgi:hypothetical protein